MAINIYIHAKLGNNITLYQCKGGKVWPNYVLVRPAEKVGHTSATSEMLVRSPEQATSSYQQARKWTLMKTGIIVYLPKIMFFSPIGCLHHLIPSKPSISCFVASPPASTKSPCWVSHQSHPVFRSSFVNCMLRFTEYSSFYFLYSLFYRDNTLTYIQHTFSILD